MFARRVHARDLRRMLESGKEIMLECGRPIAARHGLTEKQVDTIHLVDGSLRAGTPITLKIDQTLTQDATGTLVMLTLEALGLDRVSTEVSVQYVDHNLLQIDNLNADDHLFLESACRRFGIWYSRPGNGISHVVHMQRFGMPGKSLLGSDSHTPAAGALGMLAIGAGGLDVALAMSGEPFPTTMPAILGVQLKGELPDWVSAKDVFWKCCGGAACPAASARSLNISVRACAASAPWTGT